MTRQEILRILDANFNRSREGLRVCEEITRFVMANEVLTRELKKTRHAVSDCLKNFCPPFEKLAQARNVRSDVGSGPSALENKKKDARGIFLANIQRSKESLRVLEELSKLVDVKASVRLKKIRFKVYAIEAKVVSRLEAVRHR